MPVLSPATVYDLARSAGLGPSQAAIATAIAMAESGLRTDAEGDKDRQNSTWGMSLGLWQIRSLKADYGTGRARDASRLRDPAFNARAMVEISGGGQNWKPWSVYTSGAYQRFLGSVRDGASGPVPSVPPTTGRRSGGGIEYTPDGVQVPAGSQTDPAPVGVGGDPLGLRNPFAGWADDALGLGLKLVLTAGALALVVVGATRAVTPAGPA